MLFLNKSMWYPVFASSVFLGIGTTTANVLAITMEADLIGERTDGAFVFGALSLLDKVANGLLIELTSKYAKEGEIVKNLIIYIPGISCIIAVITTFTILEYYKKSKPYDIERKPFLVPNSPDQGEKRKLTTYHTI